MLKKRLPYKLVKQKEQLALLQQRNELSLEVNLAAEFVKKIEEGRLDADYASEHTEGQLAIALLRMRDQLQKISEEEKERKWSTEGLAKFVEILRNNATDIKQLGDQIITHVVKYLGANQGGLFILDDEENNEDIFLEMVACYAYERKKYIHKRVKAGEGLVGQVFLEKETTYLTELPQGYITITSGLGNASPNSLLLIPLKVNNKVYGVMELASFDTFEPYEIKFLEKLSENIASSLSNVRTNEKTQSLLQASQIQAEQMRAQDEEMRQNIEEMASIQEQLKRREEEAAKLSKKYEDILNGCGDAVVIINERGIIEFINEATSMLFGYEESELIGKNVQILMRAEHAAKHGEYLQNYFKTGEKKFIGSGREENIMTKEGKSIPVLMTISEAVTDDRRVFAAFIRDLTEFKEKEHYYEQILQALPTPIFMTDNDLKWTFINKAIGESFGLTDSNIKGMLGKECCTIDVEICKTERCAIEMMRKGNPRTDFNYDGRHFIVDSSFLYDLGGKKTGFIEVLRDATQQEKTEKALDASTSKVKALEEELAQIKEELKATKKELLAK